MNFKTIVPLVLLGASCASPAFAVEYNQVQANESTVTFGYKQMGVAGEGRFRRFSAQVAFDPAKPANAKAYIGIDLSSIDTGLKDADEEMQGSLWFNTKVFPVATFVSTGVQALGGNRYQLNGTLSIKGKALDMSVPVTFQPQDAGGAFDGALAIKRLAFAVGEGEWADTAAVADEVQIKFHFVVQATPARKK